MTTTAGSLTPAGRTASSGLLARGGRLVAGISAGAVFTAGLAVAPAHADSDAYGLTDTICTSSSQPKAAAELSAWIEGLAQSRDGEFAVGVSALGGDFTCGYQPEMQFDAASTSKVLVLATLLRQAMDEERELTSEERELTEAMITVSDNDATIVLRNRLGRDRLQGFLDLAGMDGTRLHPENYTGLMKINTADEITLLRLLTDENEVLGDEQRAYALELMGNVIDEQRWGVTAGAPDDVRTHNKNGWLPYDGTDIWRVNSIGAFTGGDAGDYQIVILTDDNDGMAYGVETIELVAERVHVAVNGDGYPSPVPFSSLVQGGIDIIPDGSDRA